MYLKAHALIDMLYTHTYAFKIVREKLCNTLYPKTVQQRMKINIPIGRTMATTQTKSRRIHAMKPFQHVVLRATSSYLVHIAYTIQRTYRVAWKRSSHNSWVKFTYWIW